MSKNRIALLLVVSLTSLGVVAGCGGDDDSGSSSSSEEAPTKAEFISQADAICQDSIDTLSEASSELGTEPSDEEVQAFAEDTYVPELNDEVEQLQALTPPEGDEETVEEMFSSLEDGVGQISDDPSIVIEDKENPLADATELANDYGLKVCGNA